LHWKQDHGAIQRDFVPCVSLGGISPPGVLDQNLPHQVSADREEMLTVLKVHRLLFHQAEIGLMNQGGCLHCVTGTLVTKVVVGDSAKLAIHERHQTTQRFLVTGPPLGQEFTDRLCWRRFWHGKTSVLRASAAETLGACFPLSQLIEKKTG